MVFNSMSLISGTDDLLLSAPFFKDPLKRQSTYSLSLWAIQVKTHQNVDYVVSKVKSAQSDKKGDGTWKVLYEVLSKL